MKGKFGMEVLGFSSSHNLRDAKGKIIKFSQRYRYILMKCPNCKEEVELLYPSINQCNKCKAFLSFCSLNDDENRIFVINLRKFIENHYVPEEK